MKLLYLAFVELDVPNACRTHVVEVIRNLAGLRHRIVAILPRPLQLVQFPKGVDVSYVYPWNFSWYGKLIYNLLATVLMTYHIIRFRPDVVYEREMGSNPLPALLCRLFQVPLFVEINGILLDLFVKAGASRMRLVIEGRLQAYELHIATGLVIPSDHLRAKLLHNYTLAPERCAFIPNGFTPNMFFPGDRAAARARMGLPNDAFALTFVGLLWSDYDLPAYLHLLARLRDEFPQLALWIIGGGPMRVAWETQAKALGLGEQVRFVGYQSEEVTADWIKAGNLCLVPRTASSLIENGALSTKIWAYAACARAIVLHFDPTQLFPEELLPLFLLIPAGDDKAIEMAVRAGIMDPTFLDQKGAANSSWVHKNATWAHTVERTIDFMLERIH